MTESELVDIQKELKEALKKSYTDGRFSAEQLFSEWFRKKGTPYFFLFKKNLSHTSMQYAEIISLIRVHITGGTKTGNKLQFLRLQEFIDNWGRLFKDIESPLTDSREKDENDLIENITELYGSALYDTVIVESFFCSCTIFIPYPLKLDLFKICSESGYIHSCGLNIYTRSLDETVPDKLITKIKTHSEQTDKTKYLAAYCHEDFTPYDREYLEELRSGLDDIKIYVEKYYLGNMSFVTFLEKLKEALRGKVIIQGPGNYIKQRKAALETAKKDNINFETERTLWLIVDRSLNLENRRFPGDKRFVICYEQEYKNCNPFHIFDENKPAWISHTTIPHKLAGAMINITRPWWPKDRNVIIADPFAGTGTIGLECLKFPKVKVDCSDSDPICKLLARDNLKYFAYSSNEVEKFIKQLDSLLECSKKPLYSPSPEIKDLSWASLLMDKWNEMDKCSKNTDEEKKIVRDRRLSIIKDLEDCENPLRRLLFYLLLRIKIRHAVGIKRAPQSLDDATHHEFKRLRDELEELKEQREKEELLGSVIDNTFTKFESTYSLGGSINRDVFKDIVETNIQNFGVSLREAKECEEEVDVIITDPPYGFNTVENYFELARIYTEALKTMVKRLKAGGQLVICLPDKSFTGRKIAAFSTSAWLIQEILTEAKAVGLGAIVEAQVLPRPTNMFRPPYYWESERALRRNILHFRFQKIS